MKVQDYTRVGSKLLSQVKSMCHVRCVKFRELTKLFNMASAKTKGCALDFLLSGEDIWDF